MNLSISTHTFTALAVPLEARLAMTSVILQAIHAKRQLWMAIVASRAEIRATSLAALAFLQDLVTFWALWNRAIFLRVFA